MSSFKSLDLFGSGPHRFIDPAEGQQIVLRLAIGSASTREKAPCCVVARNSEL